MGLIHSAMKHDDTALICFDKALKLFSKDVSMKIEESNVGISDKQFTPDSDFARAALYRQLAEKYDYQKDYNKALYYYRKTLEIKLHSTATFESTEDQKYS